MDFFLLRMVFLKRDHEFRKKKKKNKAVSKQSQLEKVMYKKARTINNTRELPNFLAWDRSYME